MSSSKGHARETLQWQHLIIIGTHSLPYKQHDIKQHAHNMIKQHEYTFNCITSVSSNTSCFGLSPLAQSLRPGNHWPSQHAQRGSRMLSDGRRVFILTAEAAVVETTIAHGRLRRRRRLTVGALARLARSGRHLVPVILLWQGLLLLRNVCPLQQLVWRLISNSSLTSSLTLRPSVTCDRLRQPP